MTTTKIFVSLDHNEMARPRAAKVEKAVLEDDRFEMRDPADLPFDLQFVSGGCPAKTFHVELKDFSEENGSDYLASILNGHLWEQCLAARELHQPLVIVVLGDDNDVGASIRKAASRATRGHRVDPVKLMEYYRMVEGFEANCIGLNIHVWRLKTDPYNRMLLRVRKIMEGGDLSGFAPAPAEGERQAVGLSILAGKGIGPAKARAILERFHLVLEPWDDVADDCYLTDCAGIGETIARRLGASKNIEVDCRHIIRPPTPKPKKNNAMKGEKLCQ